MDFGRTAMERYERLGIADALNRRYDYPGACTELSSILRLAYSKLPKNLQALVFRDTLAAFRLLPDVQTHNGISSANVLVQAAEASLPKQKKSLAVTEFKHAIVACKRQGKARKAGGELQLPEDILIQVFRFLDVRSLINVSLVCWPWHSAADDNRLWQLQYSLLFDGHDCKTREQTHTLSGKRIVMDPPAASEDAMASHSWKEALKKEYKGNLAWISAAHAVCRHCKTIFWLSHVTIGSFRQCHKCLHPSCKVNPVSASEVAQYLLGQIDFSESSESDDSDSEDLSILAQQMHKLWAYPKLESA